MYFLKTYQRGVFNRYRKGMPWPEMMFKDLVAFGGILRSTILSSSSKTILCFPHFPSRGSTIARIAKTLGWQITNKPSRQFDLAMFWEYGTIREEDKPLRELDKSVINLNSLNIAKDFVDEHMLKVFGYSTRIDPITFQGTAVRKSNINALHDGQNIECPIDPEEGFIYQKFIDSSVSQTEVMDIRVVIINQKIPHVYLNYRNNFERFKNVPDRSELVVTVDDHLSKEEQGSILNFCKSIGLEYGELDVLRDCDDLKIYVVDANNTPQGPPKNLSLEEKAAAVDLLAKTFDEEFAI